MKYLNSLMLIALAFIQMSCGETNRGSVNNTVPISAPNQWEDYEISPEVLVKEGFEFEYDKLPAHLDGNAKNEVCISVPITKGIDGITYRSSGGLLVNDEMAVNLGFHDHKGKDRTIINISDSLSKATVLYFFYIKIGTGNDFGKRYVLSLEKIVSYCVGK